MIKIALLSDIHGNTTALEAVLEDSRKAKVNEYWLLGDSLMPGTGRRALLELLEELPITVKVLGNWEDSLWRAMRGMLDETRPSHRYLMRQCQYILEEITPQEIEAMQEEIKALMSENEKLKSKIANASVGNADDQIVDVNGVKLLAIKVADVDMNGLRNLGDQMKEKTNDGVVVIVSTLGDKVNVIAMAGDDAISKGAHAGNIIKEVAKCVGGGGGGRPNMAQAGGKNPAGADDALAKAKEVLESQVK